MHKTIISLTAAVMLAGCTGGSNNTNNSTNEAANQETKTYNFLDAKEKTFDGFSVHWLKDNAEDKNFPFDLFGNIPESIRQEVNLPDDGIPSSMSAYLIKSNGKNILFDSGLGEKSGGQLIPQLQSYGVAPENIDYVYITHFHGDHIGGMLTPDGEKVFTNAEVYVSQLEKDSDLGKGEQAAKMIEKYGDKIHTFNFGDTLPEDVKAIKAIGHTPGHTVYQKGNVLIIGDLMHAFAIQVNHPEINANFDGDKDQAASTRKSILQYAKDNGLTMCGMHLPVSEK